jgi:hypothetical protein
MFRPAPMTSSSSRKPPSRYKIKTHINTVHFSYEHPDSPPPSALVKQFMWTPAPNKKSCFVLFEDVYAMNCRATQISNLSSPTWLDLCQDWYAMLPSHILLCGMTYWLILWLVRISLAQVPTYCGGVIKGHIQNREFDNGLIKSLTIS